MLARLLYFQRFKLSFLRVFALLFLLSSLAPVVTIALPSKQSTSTTSYSLAKAPSISAKPKRAKAHAENLEGIDVVFDYKGHEKEREALYRYFIAEEGIDEYHPIQEGEIGIYLYDIDNDGEEEILVYLRNPGFCGSRGCKFDIFKKLTDSGGISGEVNIRHLAVVAEKMKILNTKMLGYHDLLFTEAVNNQELRDVLAGKTATGGHPAIWKWNGKCYDLDRFLKDVHYQGN